MLNASFVFSILLQLVLPFLVSLFVVRRYRTTWSLYLVGGISYMLFWMAQPLVAQLVEGNEFYTTQIASLPVVWIFLFEGIILAVVEQAIRAGAYWYARSRIREWGQGLTVASGQASIGLLLIGLQLLLVFVSGVTLASTRGEGLNLTPEELTNLLSQLDAFLALPWYFPLLVALRGLVIFMLQMGLGMMVWQAVNQKAWAWLGAALLWETAINALFNVLGQGDPDLFTTSIFILTALANAAILYLLYQKTRPDPTLALPGK